jgi:GH15 family glucan-1,4-alpha-glucosidase
MAALKRGMSVAYIPIEDYGLIGDMHTAALVGKNGSSDWFCYPAFDSPSIAPMVDQNSKPIHKMAPGSSN